jgi:hypothetical protein
MCAFCANTDPFANGCEPFCFVWRALATASRLWSGSTSQRHEGFQAPERYFRRARQVIIRLANLFQRRDNKIESRIPHLKPSSKILRSAANSLMMRL